MADYLKKVLTALTIVCLSISLVFFFPTLKISGLTAQDFFILKNIRLAMFLTAFLVGGILSVCGLVFQTIFDNPLATPYTLGISSGASFGAVVYIVFLKNFVNLPLSLFAFAGSVFAILLIFAVISAVKYASSQTILLSGVALNFFFGSLILFFQYYANQYDTFEITRWLLGGISTAGLSGILPLAVGAAIILVFFLFNAEKLDLFLLGETLAKTKGLDTARERLVFIAVCGIAVSVSVAVAGPIGFVGIIIPHLSKKLFGIRHLNSVFYAFFLGGGALSLCQAIAVKVFYPSILPVGVITAIIGTPIFIYILIVKAEK